MLLALGAGLGMFAVSAGSADAALQQPDGGLVPLTVQGGPASLPSGTNSVKVTLTGAGSICTAVNGTNNINSGFQVREGNQITIDTYTDRACQGTQTGPGIAYRLSYNGPNPSSSFSQVLVRGQNAAVFVCSNSGWTDGNVATCRAA
ncbi:hypothetical protein ABZX85_39730 [Streptomyces sp. NPDC004539]|uniref:hypothetical protein n=1 Tax=Streptomyces sp. NPDC004539 TaxID=3154280 RepID=UPI0033BA383F